MQHNKDASDVCHDLHYRCANQKIILLMRISQWNVTCKINVHNDQIYAVLISSFVIVCGSTHSTCSLTRLLLHFLEQPLSLFPIFSLCAHTAAGEDLHNFNLICKEKKISITVEIWSSIDSRGMKMYCNVCFSYICKYCNSLGNLRFMFRSVSFSLIFAVVVSSNFFFSLHSFIFDSHL